MGTCYQRGVGCDLRVWLPHFYQRSSTCVQRCNQWLWCSCCNWSTDLLIPTAVPTGWQERAVWLFRQAPRNGWRTAYQTSISSFTCAGISESELECLAAAVSVLYRRITLAWLVVCGESRGNMHFFRFCWSTVFSFIL